MTFDSGRRPGGQEWPPRNRRMHVQPDVQMHNPYQQQPQGYPPQQQWQPQQPQVYVQQVSQGPRSAVTRRPMSITEGTFHAFMMLMTCGLWTPVYLARRRSLKMVTKFR